MNIITGITKARVRLAYENNCNFDADYICPIVCTWNQMKCLLHVNRHTLNDLTLPLKEQWMDQRLQIGNLSAALGIATLGVGRRSLGLIRPIA